MPRLLLSAKSFVRRSNPRKDHGRPGELELIVSLHIKSMIRPINCRIVWLNISKSPALLHCNVWRHSYMWAQLIRTCKTQLKTERYHIHFTIMIHVLSDPACLQYPSL